MSAPPPGPDRHDDAAGPTAGPTHFRCGCGRSVATPPGSAADRTRRCSSCRRREAAEHALERHR